MTSVAVPICYSCIHRNTADMTCEAYPDGIPFEIQASTVDHRMPYRGDHGIHFDQDPDLPEPDPLVFDEAMIDTDFDVIQSAGFDTDLHPRGRDGKFIEKFGIVKLLGDGFTKDGRRVNLKDRRARVDGIAPDPKTPGRPNIRVSVLDDQGRPGASVNVKPEGLIQAPEKARLPERDVLPTRSPGASYMSRTDKFDEPRQPGFFQGDRPQGEFARLRTAQTEREQKARTISDEELARQGQDPNAGPLWRQAVQQEQANRARRRAQDASRRAALTASVNQQAAQLSTTDAEARAEGLDEILSGLRFSIIDTDKVYDDLYPPGDGGGRWTPERAAQHEEMWNEFIANVEAAGIPKDHDSLVLGGLPGAGKSYSLLPGQKAAQFGVNAWEANTPVPEGGGATHVSISPDIVKEMLIAKNMLPEGLSDDLKPLEKVTFLHGESAYLSKMFGDRLSREGYNIVLDRTFESEGGMERVMGPMARQGYTFRGLFADIPIDESMESARKRYLKKAFSPEGGRFVPSSVQGNRKSSWGNLSKNRDAFDRFIDDDWFTDYMIIDNTGVVNGTPKGDIVAQGTGTGSAAAAYLPGNDKNRPKSGPRMPLPPEAPPTILNL